MRLFVAIDLDDRARQAIAAEQRRLTSAVDANRSPMKWVRAEHMHLTLVFLGEVSEERAAIVAPRLAGDVPQPPFDLVFEGVGVFPPHGGPRALWIGCSDGAAQVIELQRAIADRVASLDVPLESRPFSPHLTLARWKTSRPSDRARALAAARSEPIARVTIDHATLYHSRLSSAGPTYVELARANLSHRTRAS